MNPLKSCWWDGIERLVGRREGTAAVEDGKGKVGEERSFLSASGRM